MSNARLATARQPRRRTGSMYITARRPSGRANRRSAEMSTRPEVSSTWQPISISSRANRLATGVSMALVAMMTPVAPRDCTISGAVAPASEDAYRRDAGCGIAAFEQPEHLVTEACVRAQHLHDAERLGVGADDDDLALELPARAGPAERPSHDRPLDDEHRQRGGEEQQEPCPGGLGGDEQTEDGRARDGRGDGVQEPADLGGDARDGRGRVELVTREHAQPHRHRDGAGQHHRPDRLGSGDRGLAQPCGHAHRGDDRRPRRC